MLMLDYAQGPTLVFNTFPLERRKQQRFLFAMMVPVGKEAYEIDELRESVRWNVLAPLEPHTHSIESAQRPFDDAVIMLETMKRLGHFYLPFVRVLRRLASSSRAIIINISFRLRKISDNRRDHPVNPVLRFHKEDCPGAGLQNRWVKTSVIRSH
jgi:hypothetical protein